MKVNFSILIVAILICACSPRVQRRYQNIVVINLEDNVYSNQDFSDLIAQYDQNFEDANARIDYLMARMSEIETDISLSANKREKEKSSLIEQTSKERSDLQIIQTQRGIATKYKKMSELAEGKNGKLESNYTIVSFINLATFSKNSDVSYAISKLGTAKEIGVMGDLQTLIYYHMEEKALELEYSVKSGKITTVTVYGNQGVFLLNEKGLYDAKLNFMGKMRWEVLDRLSAMQTNQYSFGEWLCYRDSKAKWANIFVKFLMEKVDLYKVSAISVHWEHD